MERDGIPLLMKKGEGGIKGYLIRFCHGHENEAYNRINEIEPDAVYCWDEVRVNQVVEANALVGKKLDKGCTALKHAEEWDGKNDPFFNQGVEEVERILIENSNFDWEFRSLIRLQMAYSFLWSAIERYAGLKYHLGKKVDEKVFQIAKEKRFADSLRDHVREKRKAYSATDLRKYTLDPNNPEKSIRYYYQVRSNSIHRGKAAMRDFYILKPSLEELLDIFKDLIKEAFKK